MTRRLKRNEAPQRDSEGPGTGCDMPGCSAQGLYRAPKSRDRLRDYYWFCLDHIRDYNRNWDYYAGMDTTQIEAHLRRDAVWDRPSWPLGGQKGEADAQPFRDPFGFFSEEAAARRARAEGMHPDAARPDSVTARALALFDLTPPVSLADIKDRYKRLVKRLHPDANGGDKTAEDQLKLVNQAYRTLKDWAAQQVS